MSPLLVIVLILWLISGIGTVVMIMLHSGKGTGISDMLASQLSGTMSGTTIIEKNLDRITIILAIIFFATIFLMMVIYPH